MTRVFQRRRRRAAGPPKRAPAFLDEALDGPRAFLSAAERLSAQDPPEVGRRAVSARADEHDACRRVRDGGQRLMHRRDERREPAEVVIGRVHDDRRARRRAQHMGERQQQAGQRADVARLLHEARPRVLGQLLAREAGLLSRGDDDHGAFGRRDARRAAHRLLEHRLVPVQRRELLRDASMPAYSARVTRARR